MLKSSVSTSSKYFFFPTSYFKNKTFILAISILLRIRKLFPVSCFFYQIFYFISYCLLFIFCHLMVSNVYPIFFSETFFLVKLLWQQQNQLNVLEEIPESFLFASVKVQGISLHCEHILWKEFCLFRQNSLLKPTFVAFEDGGTT